MNDFAVAAFAIFLIQNFASFFAIYFKRNDVADIVWGPGFFLSGLALVGYKLLTDSSFEIHSRIFCVLILVGLWAIRLFFHIGLRVLKSPHEDERYQNMRRGWNHRWKIMSYTRVFMLQGVIMYIVALPIFIIIHSIEEPMSPIAYLAIAIWIFGFVTETVADTQLSSFKKDPSSKGKIMDKGLWAWSRHPNYFGEIVQWWGIFMLTLPLPLVLLAVLSPVVITFLILRVSGVTMLEKLMESRPGYKEYQMRTSKFILWPPKT